MSKIYYKPHHGLLVESMSELKTFDSVEDMISWVVKDWNSMALSLKNVQTVSIQDITIDNYGADERIGWKNNYIVYIKGLVVFGMFSTDIDEEKMNEYINTEVKKYKAEIGVED